LPKLTKKQKLNLMKSISSKSGKLWHNGDMSTKDLVAIEAIISKYMKKLYQR